MDSAAPVDVPVLGRDSRRGQTAALVFAVALVVEIVLFGLPLTPERFLIAPLLAALVLRRARAYVRDFLPFLLLILFYEELRGVAHLLHPQPYYRPQIRLEETLFFGHLPSIELQHWLWHGHLRLFDRVIVTFSSIHFLVPPALAFFFWLKDRDYFLRFAKTYLLLSFAGALTFLLYPAAPPWAAARAGVIRPVALLTNDGSGSGGTGLLLHNPYAAIPSLHAGYAMLVFLFVADRARRSRFRRPITLLAALYPLTMGFCVVYTGNHYVVDLLIGFAFTIAAFVAVPALSNRRALPSISPRFAAAFATTIAALTLLTAFAAAATGGLLRANASDDLNRSLNAVRAGRIVNLSSVMTFPWSRVYVFPGDTPSQEVDHALGFSWPEAPAGTTAPAARTAALLVFVRSGSRHREVVREVRYEGADVRMDCLMGRSFARSDARFRVSPRLVWPFHAERRALVPASASVDTLSPACLVSRFAALP